MPNKPTIIVSQARFLQPDREKLGRDLLAELTKWHHVSVTVVPHLYDLAPDGPAVQLLQECSGDMIVLSWLYPRASYWVLAANRVKGRLGRTSSLPAEDFDEPAAEQGQAGEAERTIWCFDLRTHEEPKSYLTEIAQIVESIVSPGEVAVAAGTNGHIKIVGETTRQRWYPVIDYGRCENCLECLNFCLFGVFGLDAENRVIAEQPDACRPGCPACSRICSKGAIMFPQHHEPGIAGDPEASKNLKLDLSQLFRAANPAELAAAERDRALAEKKRQEETTSPTDSSPDAPASQGSLDRLVDEVDDMEL